MQKIELIARGRKSAAVEAVFDIVETAKLISTMTFKNENAVLLATYKGKRKADIEVEEIPLTLDISLVG